MASYPLCFGAPSQNQHLLICSRAVFMAAAAGGGRPGGGELSIWKAERRVAGRRDVHFGF
jgi:hypothetical protein